MDLIKITPMVRGAYIENGGAPVILLSETEERKNLPVLNVNLASDSNDTESSDNLSYGPEERKSDSEIASALSLMLNSVRESAGMIPSGVCIPGVGSFYAGSTYNEAEKAKTAASAGKDPGAFIPRPASSRNDVVSGKIALVTGGAQGFGAEIVKGLIDSGCFVFIADINIEGAGKFAEELNSAGEKRAAAVAVDVSSEESVNNMARSIVETAGGLDLLVSNAGVLRAGSVLELSSRDFDFVTKINYSAFFLVVKQLSPIMIKQQAASPMWKTDIIQVNSKSGLQGSNKNGAYAGGKFGGIGLVQSFAMELVEYGIKVNAICPGNFFDGPLWSDPEKGLFVQYLNTGKVPGAKTVEDVKKFYEAKVPMKRGCGGDDVLKALLYCVEQEYETGQAVPVTGGQIMLK